MKKQRNPLIIYTRLGQCCIRRRPTHVSNPRTSKQQANRLRFAQRYARKKSTTTDPPPSTTIPQSSDPLPSILRPSSESTPMPLAEAPPCLEAPSAEQTCKSPAKGERLKV